LKRYFGIVNISELSKNGRLVMLKEFIIASFQAHFDGKNILAIKVLDSMTKKLLILSRNGKNIANVLNVSLNSSFVSSVIFISLVKFY